MYFNYVPTTTPDRPAEQGGRAAGHSARAYASAAAELSARDAEVVHTVAKLKQVASSHLKELVFPNVNRNVMDRRLKRLVADKYLVRIGRRAPRPQGGNTPAVYQLGRRGWYFARKSGEYWGRRAVDNHAMHVADLYTVLTLMDRDGTIKLLEPIRLEYRIGHAIADLFIDAAIPGLGKRRRFYIEVQMSARPDVIKGKLQAYLEAYNLSTEQTWPRVAIVVFDDYHQHRIKQLLPKHELFGVYLPSEFISALAM